MRARRSLPRRPPRAALMSWAWASPKSYEPGAITFTMPIGSLPLDARLDALEGVADRRREVVLLRRLVAVLDLVLDAELLVDVVRLDRRLLHVPAEQRPHQHRLVGRPGGQLGDLVVRLDDLLRVLPGEVLVVGQNVMKHGLGADVPQLGLVLRRRQVREGVGPGAVEPLGQRPLEGVGPGRGGGAAEGLAGDGAQEARLVLGLVAEGRADERAEDRFLLHRPEDGAGVV